MTDSVSRRSGDVSRRRDAVAEAEAVETDTNMTVTYVRVLIVEAIIIFLLWLIGRTFA